MKTLLQIVLLVFMSSLTFAQVGFDNDSPDPSAVLDLSATDKGLLIPRMTTQEREAIPSPANSLLVFDTSVNNYFYYTNNQWVPLSNWSSSASNDDVYLESGNVGIGTASPAYKLDVNGPVNTSALNISGTSFSAADLHPVSNGAAAITATGDWNDYGNTGFYRGADLINQPPFVAGVHRWKYVIVIRDNEDHCVQYATDYHNTASWTRVKSGGNWAPWKKSVDQGDNIELAGLTIKGNSTSHIIFNNPNSNTRSGFSGDASTLNQDIYLGSDHGNIRLRPKVGFNIILENSGTIQHSDKRLKKDIVNLDNSLEKIRALQGVNYKLIDDEGGKIQTGFVADDVLEVAPELVYVPEAPDEMKGVNYTAIIPILVEGMKEQQAQIEALKSEIKEMKK